MPAVHADLAKRTEPAVATVLNRPGQSKIVLVCEHASNHIPDAYGDLGLTDAAKLSHAAWDIGAQGLAEHLSADLDAVLVLNTVSRLVYDCNRPPLAADAMPAQSERITVPGNRDLSPAQKAQRVDTVYTPFHNAVATALQTVGPDAILVTIHSFTGVYNGQTRDTEIGLIHDDNSQLAEQMMQTADEHSPRSFCLNQPYARQHGVTHLLERHGTQNALMNVMIEVRNDLIDSDDGRRAIGKILARVLTQSLTQLGRPDIFRGAR
jgi:predicted N-formylglutamate amidohydrolase